MRQLLLFTICMCCHFLSYGDETTSTFAERFKGCTDRVFTKPAPTQSAPPKVSKQEERDLALCKGFPAKQVKELQLQRRPVELFSVLRELRQAVENEGTLQRYLQKFDDCEDYLSVEDKERLRETRRETMQNAVLIGTLNRRLVNEVSALSGLNTLVRSKWIGNYNACQRLIKNEQDKLGLLLNPKQPEPSSASPRPERLPEPGDLFYIPPDI